MSRTMAIDGPAGSGKSTVAERLSQELQIAHLDTGAMYRALTLAVLEAGIDPLQEEQVVELLKTVDLEMKPHQIFLNGRDVSKEIRSDEVTATVSVVSGYAEVRKRMVRLQQEIAQQQDVILDGRDIGTVVLPHADLKIYLTATPEVRAKRRLNDPKAHSAMSYEEVLSSIIERDRYDSTRPISPLRPAEDAILLDTSEMTLEDVVHYIRKEWER